MKNKDKYSLDKLTIIVTYTAIGTAIVIMLVIVTMQFIEEKDDE